MVEVAVAVVDAEEAEVEDKGEDEGGLVVRCFFETSSGGFGGASVASNLVMCAVRTSASRSSDDHIDSSSEQTLITSGCGLTTT